MELFLLHRAGLKCWLHTVKSRDSLICVLLNIQSNTRPVRVEVNMCGEARSSVADPPEQQQHLETEEEMGSSALTHSAELPPSHTFPASGSSNSAGRAVDPQLLPELTRSMPSLSLPALVSLVKAAAHKET